jgi:hypothetical protein
MLVEQVAPLKPATQAHVKPLSASVHEPPLAHGLDAHSLVFVAHVGPDQPATQVHV